MTSQDLHYINDNQIRMQEDSFSKELVIHSDFYIKQPQSNNQQLKKIANIITSLHQFYIKKCQDIQIYRDLTEDQQNMLIITDKNTHLHTALAGIFAIQSCIKCIEKEEQFIVGNLIRIINVVVTQFKNLQDEINTIKSINLQKLIKFGDSLKYLLQQINSLPLAKTRGSQIQKQISILQSNEILVNAEEQNLQKLNILNDLHKQNHLLKNGLLQKQNYIQILQSKIDRNTRFSKIQDKRTVHSIGIRFGTQSSENQVASNKDSAHQSEIEINRIKLELQEKNVIIKKMNQEFAHEAQKYSAILNKLEEQNKLLRRYGDIDTAYLLQELQYEIQLLRQQKRKDQIIIEEIHQKLQGFNIARNSRINTLRNYDNVGRNQRYYQQHYNIEPLPRFQYKTNHINKYKKFHSPTYNYPSSYGYNIGSPTNYNGINGHNPRISRLKSQNAHHFQYRKDIGSNNEYRGKSLHRNSMIQMIKNRLQEQKRKKSRQSRQHLNTLNDCEQIKQLKQVKSTGALNLYQRVMKKL